ncbi:MAG TPA: PASTA domain-containing protein [Candidatus Limnocylindria bacterium]|nr:PASTA domain-containing protein [Candidatus Limnocylindria bacterium]
MHRTSTQLFLGILAIGALAGLTAAGTSARRPALSPDLAILELRTSVELKRHVLIEVRITNRGQRRSNPTVVQFRSTAWTPGERRLASLGAGVTTRVSFFSPPIDPGDHELTVRVDPEATQPDVDEANNSRTAFVRLPEAAAATFGRSSRKLAVPSVLGRTEREALLTLRRAGFSITRVYQHVMGITTGVVTEQWPDPGARIADRSGPVVVLGSRVPVPEIRGLSVGAARSALRQRTLEIGTVARHPSIQDWTQKIVAQRPSSGTLSDLGTGVHVEVIDPTPAWTFAAAGFMGLGTFGLLIGQRSRPRPTHQGGLRRLRAKTRKAVVAIEDVRHREPRSERRADAAPPPQAVEPSPPQALELPPPRAIEPSPSPGVKPSPPPGVKPSPPRAIEPSPSPGVKPSPPPGVKPSPPPGVKPSPPPGVKPSPPPGVKPSPPPAVKPSPLPAVASLPAVAVTVTVPTRPPGRWAPRWDAGAQELSWNQEADWKCHWDPGTQAVAWNLETSQPTIELVLVPDAGEARVEDQSLEEARSATA